MTRINADNLFGLSDFIVDPTASKGSFTTIQSAIDAASADDVIFIKTGTYVENLTLKLDVDLIGVAGDGRSSSSDVTVIGTHLLSGNGFVVIENMDFSAPGGNIFTITGGPGQNPGLAIKNSRIDSPIGMVAQLIGGGGSPSLILIDSNANANGIGVTCADGQIQVENSDLNSNTAEAVSLLGSGALNMRNGGNLTGFTSCVTINSASANVNCINSEMRSFNASCIQFNAAGSVTSIDTLYNCNSIGGFYVAGIGTYNYAGDIINGSANQIDPVTIQLPLKWRPFATAGNSGTAVSGTARFDNTSFNVVDGFVSLIAAPSNILSSSVTLTSPQVKNLMATPIQIVPPVGAGNVPYVFGAQAKLVYGGTTPFTNPSNLVINQNNAVGIPMSDSFVSNGFIDATEDFYNSVGGLGVTNAVSALNAENSSLVVWNNFGSEITGNAADDNQIVITVFYSVLTL